MWTILLKMKQWREHTPSSHSTSSIRSKCHGYKCNSTKGHNWGRKAKAQTRRTMLWSLKQGHITCMCPGKKTHAWALNSNPSSSNSFSIGSATILDIASVMSDDTTTTTSSVDITAHVLRFLDEERDKFARVMKEGGEEMGFLDTWM